MYFGQDIDAMWEASAAREWEELNRPQPEPDLTEAINTMADAVKTIDCAVKIMDDAAKAAEDSPMAARIKSLLMDLEDVGSDISALIGKYENEAV